MHTTWIILHFRMVRSVISPAKMDHFCASPAIAISFPDVEQLYESTELPIITITRDKPDFEKIKCALQKNFTDWKERWNVLKKGELHKVKTRYNPIYVKCTGMTISEAKELINLSTIRGVIPEPIRVAHIIASGIVRGESYGKA